MRTVELEHYIVYEDGRVWGKRRPRFLKPRPNQYGYMKIHMDGYDYVHRIVYKAFNGEIPNGYEIDHIDNDRSNNHLSNLRILTRQENLARRTKIYPTGKDHWNYGLKMSDAAKQKMREAKLGSNHPRFSGWYIVDGIRYGSAQEAADITGIPKVNIYRWCKKGKPGYEFQPI